MINSVVVVGTSLEVALSELKVLDELELEVLDELELELEVFSKVKFTVCSQAQTLGFIVAVLVWEL